MRATSDFRWLILRLRPMRWRILLAMACVSSAGLAATIDPLLMRTLIDRALPQHNLRWALELAGGVGVCSFGRAILSAAAALANFSIAQRCVRGLRVSLLDQMNRLSADYHEQTPTGEKLTRIEHDVDEIASLGSDTVSQSVRAILFFALNLAMMVKLNLSMTLTLVPMMPFVLIVHRHFSVRLRARAEEARSRIGAASSILTEQLAAIPQIQFLGAEEACAVRAVSAWDKMLRTQQIQRNVQVGFGLSIGAVLAASILVVLTLGCVKVLAGSLTIGGLVAFYTYGIRVFEPLSSAVDLYARLQSVGVSVRRVRQLLELEPTVQNSGTEHLESSRLIYGFEIRDVSFSYGRDAALRNITLRLVAQERIAIIGASGSGKSTLARLLARGTDPDSGSILLEQRPLTDYTLGSLRSSVCYVPQQPVLFEGTIRENLLYANPQASSEQMLRAMHAAQLSLFLSRLPQGLDASLGPGAINLSGGERQRLAIARSLLRRAPAIVLDEATSALDVPTERAVFESIATFHLHQTVIVISHRIGSLAWVDRLVLLDKGRIVGAGSHSALYALYALYRQLFDASLREQRMPFRTSDC